VRDSCCWLSAAPAYSQWLLGPISRMATGAEIDAYLALDEDSEAQTFIESFWRERSNPDSPWPTDQPRAVFERRLAEADTRFSEGTKVGRWTDRGTIYILYGAPEKSYFEVPERPRNSPRQPEPVEVWSYPKDAPRGLDGEKPKRKYFFVKRGEATVLWRSHYDGVVRMFWIWLLLTIIGTPLILLFGLGYLILGVAAIWTAVVGVVGLFRAADNRPA